MRTVHSGQKVCLEAWFGRDATELRAAVAAAGTTLYVRDETNYAQNDVVMLDAGDEDIREYVTASAVTGDALTVGAVTYAHGAGSEIKRAADPTTVTLTVLDPAGASTSYTYALATVTKDGTGRYSKELTVSTEGVWRYRWVGTGLVAVTEGAFRVLDSAFV